MRNNLLTIAFLTLIGLSGCSKSTPPPATGPVATVMLKDGSTFSGTVTKSDTSAITLTASTGEARTYPMTQVSSVQYGSDPSPAPPAVSANTPAPSNAPAPPQSTATASVPTPNPAPPPPTAAPLPPPTQPVAEFRTIPSGTTLRVRNDQTIDSQTASTGQTYPGVVAEDVADSQGRVVIPHGSSATLIVRGATDQGRVQGRSELVLDLASVRVGGRTYRLETTDLVQKGAEGVGANKRTGGFVGGGAALGGIIGAIAGGGKGAAIGALSGAGAGAGTQALTRGKAVRVPAETVLSFRLEAPIRIREMR